MSASRQSQQSRQMESAERSLRVSIIQKRFPGTGHRLHAQKSVEATKKAASQKMLAREEVIFRNLRCVRVVADGWWQVPLLSVAGSRLQRSDNRILSPLGIDPRSVGAFEESQDPRRIPQFKVECRHSYKNPGGFAQFESRNEIAIRNSGTGSDGTIQEIDGQLEQTESTQLFRRR